MTTGGWIAMLLCWTVVTGFSGFLVYQTLRKPRGQDSDTSSTLAKKR